MKKQSLLILAYSGLIFMGGLMGFLFANSLASLVASSIVTGLLLGCALFMWNGNKVARVTALAIICMLTLFFSYRFFMTHKIMPSAIMSMISGGFFFYLTQMESRKKIANNKT